MMCDGRGAAADACKSGLETGSERALQCMVYGVPHFQSVDELMLFNALALHQRQLLRLQQADDWAELLQVNHHFSASKNELMSLLPWQA